MMSVSPLFARLVDDAGLFPPERLPMPEAMARHRADAAADHPVLSSRFLCPASQLTELQAELDAAETLRLGLIADTGPAGWRAAVDVVASDTRLRLETLEIALPEAQLVDAARTQAPALAAVDALVFVEIPRVPAWRDALEVAADAGLGAKVRCGGVRAEAFPTRAELAAFVVAAVARGVLFKATAGLHHAVRYLDPETGFHHHGFLNLLVAVCRAVEGAAVDEVAAALAVGDGVALAAEARATDDATAAAARRALVAYGSCSTSEPVADLAALDLI